MIYLEIEEWLDKHGFLHLHKSPEIDESENNPMYSGLLSIFHRPLLTSPMTHKINHKNKLFRANADREWGSHFSHDNMTGLYCIYKNRGSEVFKKLPTMKWNGEIWWHPRDIAFYFWAKHPILGLPTLPIASIAMIISCIQKYKVRNGVKIIKTDGKLLTYMRCKSFDMTLTFKICSFIIKHHKYFDNWNDVAVMYFKDVDHPLRKFIK